MAVSVVNWTSAGFRWPTVGSSIDVPNPGSATTGDLVLLFLFRYDTYVSGDVGTPGGLSGWNNLFDSAAADKRFGVWYKDWASGTNCATLSSLSTGAYYAYAAMAVRGHTTTGISYSAAASGTNTTVAGASLTAATGDLLISTLGIWDPFTSGAATVTHPSGMTSRVAGSSSNGVDLGGGYAYIQLYVDTESPSAGSTGTRSWVADDPAYDLAEMTVRNVIIPAAGATTHDASATRATTATLSAVAVKDAVVGATSSVTSTQTAAAELERVAAASSSVTASLAAEATVERAAAAALAVTSAITASAAGSVDGAAALSATATVTAAADVVTPGVVSIAASLSVTGSITGAAALEAVVAAVLAATATSDATGFVPTVHDASASLAVTATPSAEAIRSTVAEATASVPVTATVTAAANVLVGGIGDPGTMHAFDVAGATMSPAGSGAATMRTVLVEFNTATMQAVLDDSASAPLLGVPVFVGADDPVTLGLVALTTPHVWFHSGTVTVREG